MLTPLIIQLNWRDVTKSTPMRNVNKSETLYYHNNKNFNAIYDWLLSQIFTITSQ